MFRILSLAMTLLPLPSSPLGAQSWRPTAGPDGGALSALTVDSSTHIVYAGTLSSGVYRSTDEGWSWGPLVSFKKQVNHLLADGRGRVFVSGPTGVDLSTDNGASFQSRNNGLATPYVLSTIATANGDLYAVTNQSGVYRSTNSGNSWSGVNAGIASYRISCIAEGVSGSIFAGSYGWGLFRSRNNGGTWEAVNDGLASDYINALFRRSDGVMLTATRDGIYQSTDDGESWGLYLPLDHVSSISEDRGGDLYFVTDSDALRLLRGAGKAEYITAGLSCNSPSALVPLRDGTVLASLRGGEGIQRSSDNGSHWSESNTGLSAGNVLALTALRSGSVYAGFSDGGFHHTTDAGFSWRKDPGPDNCSAVACILEANDGTMYAGASALLRSSDGGQSWEQLGSPSTFWIQNLSETTGGILYAATPAEVLASRDHGNNWDPATPPGAGWISCMSALPDGTLLVAPFDGGILRSVDAGVTWRADWKGVRVNAFRSAGSDSLFALHASGMLLSSDRGQTWATVASNHDCRDLALGIDGTLWLATLDAGVLCSKDHGITWGPVNTGFPTSVIRCLAWGGKGTLLAGTSGFGVYSLTTATFVRGEKPEAEQAFRILGIHPDPFAERTRIDYAMPAGDASPIRLSLLDLFGREVAVLADGRFEGGIHSVTFVPPSSLPNGLYFCLLLTGKERMARRMLLVR